MLVLLAASLTVQVTVVNPIGKTTGALLLTIKDPTAVQLSDTIGVPKATVVLQFPVPSSDVLAVIISVGQVIVGGVVSFAVNTTVFISVFPAASVAVTVTLMMPLCDEATTDPRAGLWVIVTVQLSVAVPFTSGMVTEQDPLKVIS